MAGSLLPAVAGGFESLDSTLRAGGAEGPSTFYSADRKASRQANRAARKTANTGIYDTSVGDYATESDIEEYLRLTTGR
jgi:hypothetical protein